MKYVVFKGYSWTSKMIKFWTRSLYSHIGYLTEQEQINRTEGLVMVPTLIECWMEHGESVAESGVHWGYVSPPFRNHKPGTEIEVWKFDEETKWWHGDKIDQAIRKLADSRAGYDWSAVLGFIWKWRRDNPKGSMCSEGCIRPLVEAFGWDRINPAHVSPEDFVRIIQAAGAKRIYEGAIEGWEGEDGR